MSGYVIGEDFVNEWNRIRSKVDGIHGAGIHNSPSGIAHDQPQGEQNDSNSAATVFKIKIDGPIDDNGKGRYLGKLIYGVTESSPADLTSDYLGDRVSEKTVEVWNVAESDLDTSVPMLPIGFPILAILGGFNKDSGKPIYLTSTTRNPKGMYQYMQFQMLTDETYGWAPVKAHPLYE